VLASNEIELGALVGDAHVTASSLILIPYPPTATYREPEKLKLLKKIELPEFLDVHVTPSGLVRIFPL
jgi:hypothetical protein